MAPTLLMKLLASTGSTPDCSGGSSLFGIPTWYQYLESAHLMSLDSASQTCQLSNFNVSEWPTVIMLIVLAILDIVLKLAGMVAIAFVIYGGTRYVTSNGSPDKVKEAQLTLRNALIGLAIALVATALVSYIGTHFG